MGNWYLLSADRYLKIVSHDMGIGWSCQAKIQIAEREGKEEEGSPYVWSDGLSPSTTHWDWTITTNKWHRAHREMGHRAMLSPICQSPGRIIYVSKWDTSIVAERDKMKLSRPKDAILWREKELRHDLENLDSTWILTRTVMSEIFLRYEPGSKLRDHWVGRGYWSKRWTWDVIEMQWESIKLTEFIIETGSTARLLGGEGSRRIAYWIATVVWWK